MPSALLKRGAQRGQSTTEFMLMVPVILSLFFFIINMGLYFTAVHYTNYATYVTARSRIVAYGTSPEKSPSNNADSVAGLVLTGRAFQGNFEAKETGTGSVSVNVKGWATNFPFLSVLMPDAPFTVNVGLGVNEYSYETSAAQQQQGPQCSDNNFYSNPC